VALFQHPPQFNPCQLCDKALSATDPGPGSELTEVLESAKWYLWHGNVTRSLETLEDAYCLCEDELLQYQKQKKLLRHLDELWTYIDNNRSMIPNYGEKYSAMR
jgi:hypothetical protein